MFQNTEHSVYKQILIKKGVRERHIDRQTERQTDRTVSYTHLDVYKRQVKNV